MGINAFTKPSDERWQCIQRKTNYISYKSKCGCPCVDDIAHILYRIRPPVQVSLHLTRSIPYSRLWPSACLNVCFIKVHNNRANWHPVELASYSPHRLVYHTEEKGYFLYNSVIRHEKKCHILSLQSLCKPSVS